jgi:hypothetical protein
MSLINDALKRAKEAQRNDPPSGMSPLRSVESDQKEREFNLALPVVIVFLVVAAFVLIGLAMVKHADKKNPAETLVAAPVIALKPEAVAAIPLVTNTPPSTTPETNPPASVAAVNPPAVLVEVTNPVVTNPPPTKPLRLQGIAYDAVRPSAIIGGKAVHVGSLVDGMRVTAISPNSVTLTGNGQTKTLVVGEP